MNRVGAFGKSVLVLLVMACSSPDASSTGDAAPQPDGTASPDGAAGGFVESDANFVDAKKACNTLDLGAAAAIPLTQVASQEPVAMGGTISDGTYLLTKFTIYTGPGGATGPLPLSLKVRRDLAGGTFQTVQDDGSNVRHFTATLTTTDTAFTETDTCPGTTVDQGTYSATTTTFTEWASDKNQIVEAVFTKQ
jgi:hypothetical protein